MKFEQTYQEYFKRIYAYIYARVMTESAADDICSAVWQKVYEKQSYYNSAKGNISQWLFTIARNEVNSYFRSYYIKHFFSLAEHEEAIAAKEKTPIEAISLEDDKKRYPLKRYGKPEEVAHAVIYLLSDASAWVTGSNLLIDGGYTLLKKKI